MKRLAILLLLIPLSACSVSRHIVSSDGKSTVDDNNIMDTVVTMNDGPGCAQSVDPYVPPATPAPAPLSLGVQRLCDANGGNCKDMVISARAVGAVDPTICNTTTIATKGLGFGPYMAVGASIFAMIGLALGGF